ncbi:MAD2L1-binding protein-like, partial [Clarias magur]
MGEERFGKEGELDKVMTVIPEPDCVAQSRGEARVDQTAAGEEEDTKENRDSTRAAESQQESSLHMTCQQESDERQMSAQQSACENDDEEIARRAREEGRVDVIFPGSVTQDGCCRFVCELLKFVLYQRQQLPMTYDQMVFFQKQQLSNTQLEEGVVRKSIKSGDSTWQRCQRTLRDLDDVLGHLEVLFSLSYVPRVLLMLGSSGILPTE